MRNKRLFNLTLVSLTAAIFVAICYVLQPISFGPIQLRFSDILCLFSIDYLWALFGVSLGCFISNTFIGGLGIIDAVFGTLSTVVSCSLAYMFRKRLIKGYPLLSTLMIVLTNAIIIGAELAYILNNQNLMWLYMIQVGIGELVVLLIGLPIYKKIKVVIDKRLAQ